MYIDEKQETFTKSEIVKMFIKSQFETNEHLEKQAKERGKSPKIFAKNKSVELFNVCIKEKSIIKIGRRYKFN